MNQKLSDVADVKQNLKRIADSPSYRIAGEDEEFLKSAYGRASRLLAEYTKTERILEDARIESTVVVFGSARIKSPDVAQRQLEEIENQLAQSHSDSALELAYKKARHALKMSKYYQCAREFGELVATKNSVFNEERNERGEIKVSEDQNYVICTGGGPGVMEAANRGAYDAGKATIGLNISLPFEQFPNPFVTPSLCFEFRYFAIRKLHFILRAKALVAFPGGFGTFDELFEALTLCQTGKSKKIPIILFGKEFWDGCVKFQYLADSGMISQDDLKLFHYAETAQEGWEIIESFYANAEGSSQRSEKG